MSHSYRPTLLALVVALTTSLTVEAAEWSAEPVVSLREEYDDNYRLTRVEHDTVWGTILEPRISLRRRSDLWDISATERLKASQYTGQDGLDTIDNYFNIAAKRPLERGSFNAKAAIINDTTLQNEELDFDTGITVRQIDRMRRSLNLGGEYMLTETNWLEASLDYSMVSYDDGIFDNLYDYDTLTPDISLVHQYNPQLQVFGTLAHSETKYDDLTDTESKTDSAQLGFAYDITETWNIRASVGRQRTTTSNVLLIELTPTPVARLGETESTGLVYDATLTREFETGRISLSASQASEPSSSGISEERTRIGLNGDLRFSTKLSAQLAVSYNQSSSLGGATLRQRRSGQDEDRYRIAPSLSWRLDEELSLSAGYIYRRVDDSTIYDAVDSNSVYVNLGYAWPRMSVSR